MSQKRQRTYVPKSKVEERDGHFGSFIKVGFNADALIEFARTHKNERGYLNLVITRRRNPEPDGATHSIYLDDYQPSQRKPLQPAREAAQQATEVPDDQPPFGR